MYAHVLCKWCWANNLMNFWPPVLVLLVYWCYGVCALYHRMLRSSQLSNDNYIVDRLNIGPSIQADDYSKQVQNIDNDLISNIPQQNSQNIQLHKYSNYRRTNKHFNGRNYRKIIHNSLLNVSRSNALLIENKNRFSTMLEKPNQLSIYELSTTKSTNKHLLNSNDISQRMWTNDLRIDTTKKPYYSNQLNQKSHHDLTASKIFNHNNEKENYYIQNNKLIYPRQRRESKLETQLQGYDHQSPRINRYCSARDPATLAFEAPTVFDGKVRSMSSDRRRNFSVTFEVKVIYKRQPNFKVPLLLRLKFSYRKNSECDIYKETWRSRGYVRDELEQGKVYILFVEQIDVGNYKILGQPIQKTKKTVSDVKYGISEQYGHRASIESLLARHSTTREGRRIKIICKIQGQPPPKVRWFKDGRSIERNRSKYQFVVLRKRAELIIKSAWKEDAGQYECRAKNKIAREPVKQFTRIDVLSKVLEVTTQPTNWAHLGSPCPVIGDAFCLNGGVCVFFKDVGEPACKCSDGFRGNRCETKNPTTLQTSTYTQKEDQQCGDKKFYGGYYC